MFRRRIFFTTFSLFSPALSLDQILLAFTLNQMLIRRQSLVLDHDEAEAEEEKGLHSASDRMLLADHRVQFNFDTNWTLAAIKYESTRAC